jgi:CDP-6-deoxy-D-xylo-4-hexulose-3-dehydrase
MSTHREKRDAIIELVKSFYNEELKGSDYESGTSKINYAGRVFDEDEMEMATEAVLDFWLTQGRFYRKFERDLSNYLGVKHSLLVNSGSSANLLAFMALTSPLLGDRQIHRGDEVITVAACFPTTIAPIVQYGAVPVFVDVFEDTLNIDTTRLEAALSDKTKAIMIAHTLGNPFDVKTVKDFCDKHNLWLIEDNCDALGSEIDGQLTGTFGDIGTSSFYPPHHITMGEGGAVYTNDETLKKILASLRDWGRDCWCESGRDNTCQKRFDFQLGSLPKGYDHKYIYSHFGYNLKATDIQAAIGIAQLKKLPSFVEKRRENTEYLVKHLASVSHIIKPFVATDGASPSWFGLHFMLTDDYKDKRRELVTFIESKKIQTRMLFSGNVVRHPCFDTMVEGKDYRIVGGLDVTEALMERGFWIGVYPGMTQPMLDDMIAALKEFCETL